MRNLARGLLAAACALGVFTACGGGGGGAVPATLALQTITVTTQPAGPESPFGSSLGGLFAAHVFLHQPELFDSYIATSPALWWDDEAEFHAEAALAETREDVDSQLVLAVGELEENPRIPMLAQFKMVTNVHRMAESLSSRGYESLRLTKMVLDGESHTSVVPVALTRGLRAIYSSRPG